MSPAASRSRATGSGADWLTWANAVTAIRIPMAPLCAWAILNDDLALACLSFAVAVITDLLDGRIARARGEVSRAGGILDHASDAFFVASGLAAYAALGVVPWLLAPLLALAFVQYALDSRVLSGRRLRSSRVGRLNGVAYFVLLGTPLVRDALGWPWPANGWIFVAGWGLVVSTAFSMIDRARAWLLSRRVPDSPGAER